MEFKDSFCIKEQIELLQNWILINSWLYYFHDKSIVDDYTFDANMYQLIKLMEDFPEDTLLSKYYEPFVDYGAGMNAFLYRKCDNRIKKMIDDICEYLINIKIANS